MGNVDAADVGISLKTFLLVGVICVVSMVFILGSTANADDRIKEVWGAGGEEFDTPQEACDRISVQNGWVAARPPVYTTVTPSQTDASGFTFRYQCEIFGTNQSNGVQSRVQNTQVFGSQQLIEHDHNQEEEPSDCSVGTEHYSTTSQLPPSGSVCIASCEYSQSDTLFSGGQYHNFYIGNGNSCSVQNFPSHTQQIIDESTTPPTRENIEVNEFGEETGQYTAPSEPPTDAVPDTTETPPSIVDGQEGEVNGSTVSTYTSIDGSEIVVITAPDGSVTFTDIAPTGGDTTYVLGGGSTGSTDGGGSDTGSTDGNNGDGNGQGDGFTGTGANRTASGGGTCEVAPVCAGDAIDCAVVSQAWSTRCAVESLAEEVPEDEFINSTAGRAVFDIVDQLGTDILNDTDGFAAQLEDGAQIDMASFENRIPNAGGSFGFMNTTVMGQTMNFGTELDSAWGRFAPVFEFGMWATTTMAIYYIWFGGLMRLHA